MAGIKTMHTRVLALAFAVAFAAGVGCSASAQMGGGGTDKRKLTTIQTAKHDAVEVRYLNLPFGERTFGYMAVGGDDYYSNRTWPFAHLTLAKTASWQGHDLAPGDYVLYITPKSASAPMSLTVASFKPNDKGTFLVAGDVFVETPKDAVAVASVPVTFDKKEPMVDHLDIAVNQAGDGADVVVHYGDHWLTQHLTIK
jgi:hypothetical protein